MLAEVAALLMEDDGGGRGHGRGGGGSGGGGGGETLFTGTRLKSSDSYRVLIKEVRVAKML